MIAPSSQKINKLQLQHHPKRTMLGRECVLLVSRSCGRFLCLPTRFVRLDFWRIALEEV